MDTAGFVGSSSAKEANTVRSVEQDVSAPKRLSVHMAR
jgi:hypothetical protein